MVLSGNVVTLNSWYSLGIWLLQRNGTLFPLGYSDSLVLCFNGTLFQVGYSPNMVLSGLVVTLNSWYSLGIWLLKACGTLRAVGYSSAMVLSDLMVTRTLWYSHCPWLLQWHGTLLQCGYSIGQLGGAIKCVCPGSWKTYGFGGGSP